MKSIVVTALRTDFQGKLNDALVSLKSQEIIDVKFTSGQGNNDALILCALILYKD